MNEFINVMKQGVVVRQFSTDHFLLSAVNGLPQIHDKETRKLICVISPLAFDYIEIERYES